MKHRIKKVILRLAYWLGIDNLFYCLNRKAKRVIVFHNVLDDRLLENVKSLASCIALSQFKMILGECAKHFSFSNDISDPETVTVTFDDGYKNQYSTAFKYMKSKHIPGCLFWSSGTRRGGLAIDQAMLWRDYVPQTKIPGGDVNMFWHKEFWPRFMKDGDSRGAETLKWLDGIHPFSEIMQQLSPEFIRERLTGVSDNELSEMQGAGWLVGWHTKSHMPLVALDDTALKDELTPPINMATSFAAYPFGTEELTGRRALQIASEVGLPLVFSYTSVSPLNNSPFFAPRMSCLGNDKYEVHANLSGFQHFISYRRLLPR